MFKNKILLITGGTGSFGNAVTRKFINSDIKEIRIFSRDEKKQDDMRRLFNNSKLKFFIGDVRDINSLREAFTNVDFIFHAAALKQVPSCEFFPMEAVKTNIIGTDNVLQIAIETGVKKVICLSTDKAAYPVNAMGISKALMEKTFIAKSRNQTETIICGTRYGNVIGSRGSVIPLFISQAAKSSDLTVTDLNMTRFIMDLSEAVDLVQYAFINGKQGDIFVQKADACKIGNLALAIIKLLQSNSKIRVIGPRHGEKNYEVLLTKEEASNAIDEGDFYRIPSDNRDLNYNNYLQNGFPEIQNFNEYNSNSNLLSVSEIINKLKKSGEIQDLLNGINF
jgi:UDP-glucose 4-epimerase